MWRYLAGGGAVIAAAGAGLLLWSAREVPSGAALPVMPTAAASTDEAEPGADAVPEASPRTREQKRFGRYDKDRDGTIAREEYLAPRRKAFAKLDRDGDGRLSFDEWATKTEAKFAAADADKSGTMTPAEFATTAVKRKPARKVPCPPQQPAADEA